LAESTKIALLANTYNAIYEALRSEDQNPEARMVLKEMMFQNGWRSGEYQMKLTESDQAHSC